MTPNLLLVMVCSKFATSQVLPASTYRLQASPYSRLRASPYTFSYVPPKALFPWIRIKQAGDRECQTCNTKGGVARSSLKGHPSDPRLRAGFPLFATETLPCCNETTTTTRDCTCGKTKTSTKIVGGTETEVNQYPWIALLNLDGSQCGGSLIADKWVLTAAHCFYDPNTGTLRVTDPTKITITLGEHDQSITTESTLTKAITPDLQKLHDGYVFSSNVNDIALLRLPAAEDLNVYTPVCLPPTGADYVGKTAVVYGWGTTFFGFTAPVSDVLLDVEVPVVSDDSAKTNLGVDDEQVAVMLFAGGVVADKDSCQGDSGGPLSYDDSGKHIQIGVVSWGNGCGLINNPGAYAEVSVFRTWIDQQIAANDGGAFCTA